MTKKKRFGISQALTRGLSETINVVENNAGIFRNIILPLSRIELDPDNPRKLAINLLDVQYGIKADDPLFQRKHEELEKLNELAITIINSGVINPIVVYKRGELYRVVAGERRCLASILAKKNEIEARVFNEKPKGFELKLVQWIENTAREDLNLDERLGNIRDVIDEYCSQFGKETINATELKGLTGLSLPQSTYYLAVLNAPQDVKAQIEAGSIRSLDKAALISGVSSYELRNELIAACVRGESLKNLRRLLIQQKSINKHKKALKTAQVGRSTTKINMGSTLHPKVVKTLIDSVVEKQEFTQHLRIFSEVNWSDVRQITKAFRKLIELLETQMVV